MPLATAAADPADEPPRDVPRVPRVKDWAKVTVNACCALTEPMHIRFSDDDRSGVLEFGNTNCILSGHAVFETLKSSGGSNPSRIVEVFDTHRYAMQRSTPLIRLYFTFRHVSLLSRLVRQYGYECVEPWVDLFNPPQAGIYNFYRRDYLRSNTLTKHCDLCRFIFLCHDSNWLRHCSSYRLLDSLIGTQISKPPIPVAGWKSSPYRSKSGASTTSYSQFGNHSFQIVFHVLRIVEI